MKDRENETRRVIEQRKREVGACELCGEPATFTVTTALTTLTTRSCAQTRTTSKFYAIVATPPNTRKWLRLSRNQPRPRVPIICIECGKEKRVTPSTLFWRGAKFCSRECYLTVKERTARGEGNVPSSCKVCGKNNLPLSFSGHSWVLQPKMRQRLSNQTPPQHRLRRMWRGAFLTTQPAEP